MTSLNIFVLASLSNNFYYHVSIYFQFSIFIATSTNETEYIFMIKNVCYRSICIFTVSGVFTIKICMCYDSRIIKKFILFVQCQQKK